MTALPTLLHPGVWKSTLSLVLGGLLGQLPTNLRRGGQPGHPNTAGFDNAVKLTMDYHQLQADLYRDPTLGMTS